MHNRNQQWPLLTNAGNLGNLILIIVPAVCDEDGSPFGKDPSICRSRGLSYSSLSMAVSFPSFGSIKGLPIFFVSQIYTYTSPVIQFE
jgi:hypothetical protein